MNIILESSPESDFFESYPNFAEKLSKFPESFKSEAINNSLDEDSNTGLCTFQVFFFNEKNLLDSAFICSTQYERTGELLKFSDFIADELSEEVYFELKGRLKK